MKLRISSCKKTAFWKNVTRFFPVWLGWLLFLGFIFWIMSFSDPHKQFPNVILGFLLAMGFLTSGYALLVAMVLFGDLLNRRMCNTLHAMPLKREDWFSVHIRSGLAFCMVPSAIVAIVTSLWLWQNSNMHDAWQAPLFWWAGTNIMYLVFFGLAVFSVMCVGNRFAMFVVYCLLTDAHSLIMMFVRVLYLPLLHGVDLFPETTFVTALMLPILYADTYQIDDPSIQNLRILFINSPGSWISLLGVILVGIVLLLLARWMYKRRHLERAGDFAASSGLKAVLQIIMTLIPVTIASSLHILISDNWADLAVYLGIGLLIGWFASKMLLARSTRVFGTKSWLGLSLMAAALALSLLLTHLDPLGIEDWVPRVDQVKKVEFQLDDYSSWNYVTEDPDEIADLLRAHSLALEDKLTDADVLAATGADYFSAQKEYLIFHLTYTLETGNTAQRWYYIPVDSEEGRIAKQYYSSEAYILQNYAFLASKKPPEDLMQLTGKLTKFTIDDTVVPEKYKTEEFAEELLLAIRADCEAGTIAQNEAFHKSLVLGKGMKYDNLYITLLTEDGAKLSIQVYPDSINTLEVLKKTGAKEYLLINN